MLGAIAGDIIGSIYEWNNIKSEDFLLFSSGNDYTDDTVLTVAVADCIMNNKPYAKTFKEYYRNDWKRGYGGKFTQWVFSKSEEPYNSWGNGSAMRVSPVGFAFNSIEKVLAEAKKSAEVTHNHCEGIKGAQATAAAVYLARTGESKDSIKSYIEGNFGYNLSDAIENIRLTYKYDMSCQGSVPQAIIAFLESKDYESAIRKAISIGGDSDTIACITGGIAQAFYRKIPSDISNKALSLLNKEMTDILLMFNKKYGIEM